MTAYKTRDGQEFERYEKFTTKSIAGLTWIPLLVGENRVRYFEASQLTEVVDPRLTGMVYCYPAIPQNFDSGLDYCYPQPAPNPYKVMGKDEWIDDSAEDFLGEAALARLRAEPPKPLTVVLTPEMAANVNASALVEIVVRKPVAVSLWADGLRVA